MKITLNIRQLMSDGAVDKGTGVVGGGDGTKGTVGKWTMGLRGNGITLC